MALGGAVIDGSTCDLALDTLHSIERLHQQPRASSLSRPHQVQQVDGIMEVILLEQLRDARALAGAGAKLCVCDLHNAIAWLATPGVNQNPEAGGQDADH